MSIAIGYRDGQHWCEWGVIEYLNPQPERGEVGPLMLADASWVGFCEAATAKGEQFGGEYSYTVTRDGERSFVHLEYEGQRWAWELHEAHWATGGGRGIYLGRWPD